MKKILLLLMLLCAPALINGQVGINTENPQGVFHVDPLKNTNGATGAADDVIMTKGGDIGIGTVNPTKKLEVVSSTPGAIRIVDGTQGGGKVLTTDAGGTVTWQSKSGTWFAMLTGGNLPYTNELGRRQIPFAGASVSSPGVGNADVVLGRITVPYSGVYRITIFGRSLMNRATGYFIAGYFWVSKNGSYFWAPHSLGNTTLSNDIYVSYSTLTNLNVNGVLAIAAHEIDSGYANAVADLTMLVEFIQ